MKWIGGPMLVLGLGAIGAVVWLDSTGAITLEPGRTVRSDELAAVPADDPDALWQSLSALLPVGSSLTDGVLTVSYANEIYTEGGVLERLETEIVTPLAELDTLIYATSYSNSSKAQDTWSINAFCSDAAPCIEEARSSPARGDKRERTGNTTLIDIRGQGDAIQAVQLLSGLVAAHGGTARVEGTIRHLEREYRNTP